MAISPLRVGLELEMHTIRLTFRHSTGNFWDPEADLRHTLIGKKAILVPTNQDDGFINPDDPQKVLWEKDWGFRAVGDAFGSTTINPEGRGPIQVGSCILELATAARPVDDVTYVGCQIRKVGYYLTTSSGYVRVCAQKPSWRPWITLSTTIPSCQSKSKTLDLDGIASITCLMSTTAEFNN